MSRRFQNRPFASLAMQRSAPAPTPTNGVLAGNAHAGGGSFLANTGSGESVATQHARQKLEDALARQEQKMTAAIEVARQIAAARSLKVDGVEILDVETDTDYVLDKPEAKRCLDSTPYQRGKDGGCDARRAEIAGSLLAGEKKANVVIFCKAKKATKDEGVWTIRDSAGNRCFKPNVEVQVDGGTRAWAVDRTGVPIGCPEAPCTKITYTVPEERDIYRMYEYYLDQNTPRGIVGSSSAISRYHKITNRLDILTLRAAIRVKYNRFGVASYQNGNGNGSGKLDQHQLDAATEYYAPIAKKHFFDLHDLVSGFNKPIPITAGAVVKGHRTAKFRNNNFLLAVVLDLLDQGLHAEVREFLVNLFTGLQTISFINLTTCDVNKQHKLQTTHPCELIRSAFAFRAFTPKGGVSAIPREADRVYTDTRLFALGWNAFFNGGKPVTKFHCSTITFPTIIPPKARKPLSLDGRLTEAEIVKIQVAAIDQNLI